MLRAEIAAVAARLIAEEGMPWDMARRKALRGLVGSDRPPAGLLLPDDAELEQALRLHQNLFQSHTQPAQCRALRRSALDCMRLLGDFSPYVSGPVLRGTADQHDVISLQLYTDSAKDVAIFLLNAGVKYEAVDPPGKSGREGVEALAFSWADAQFIVTIYDSDGLRRAVRTAPDGSPQRADAAALARIIEADEKTLLATDTKSC